ncbi:HNH endonuclease [Siminovitchia sp. 179-K 8D1 HS]|uniref:HNH endonuclease n=1 Tax=Siminovitchia sp. 179-K 8D1 HS TaxID=3142385 RepID=UPI00399F2BD8
MHKSHEISEEEWLLCKQYFNSSCAYCGLHEDDHYIIYAGAPKKTDLHKEHVDHDGSNKIDNCVPSCQTCNSKKWAFTLDEWYTEENEHYSEERLNKILRWTEKDHKLAIVK